MKFLINYIFFLICSKPYKNKRFRSKRIVRIFEKLYKLKSSSTKLSVRRFDNIFHEFKKLLRETNISDRVVYKIANFHERLTKIGQVILGFGYT